MSETSGLSTEDSDEAVKVSRSRSVSGLTPGCYSGGHGLWELK